MKIILPSFTMIFALGGIWGFITAYSRGENAPLAVAGNSASKGVISEGDALLSRAQARIAECRSLEANLRHRVALFGNELIGAGLYQQQGQGSELRLRLELRTQLSDKPASQIQVRDRNYLWMYEDVATPTLLRVDMARVQAAQRQKAGLDSRSPVAELALGGMSKLMAGLRASFRPVSVVPGHLENVPVWAIELEWKPEMLAVLIPEQAAAAATGPTFDLSKLPQMPERAMLYLNQQHFFPERIEYQRRSWDGRAGEGRGAYRPIVSVDFIGVKFDEPIDERQFEYQPPPQLAPVDITEEVLKMRGLPTGR